MRRSINLGASRFALLTLLALLALVFSASHASAQFDPAIGHYMCMPTAFNPAAVGEDDLMKVSGMHNMQFSGIKGAPMSTHFTFHSAFKLGKTHHGAGIRFLNDRYGLWSNQTAYAQYAYRQKIGKGYLAIGAELGFVNVKFSGDSVNLDDMEAAGSEFHVGGDPSIPIGVASGMKFDMGLGLYYSTPRWFAGASYSHLLQPRVEMLTQSGTENDIYLRIAGTFYAMGGYTFRLRNPDYAIQPSAMLLSDFSSWNIDLALVCSFKDRFRWGLNYRIGDGVGILLGAEIVSGLEIGYNYELPTSKLLLESYGSHEIFLSYGFNILRPKRTNRYKSVRFL